jgi:hypothetical protein
MALALACETMGEAQGLDVVWPYLRVAILHVLEGVRVTRTVVEYDQSDADDDNEDRDDNHLIS